VGECCQPFKHLSEVAKNASGERQGESRKTAGNKEAKAQVHDKGSKVGGGGCSLQRVWMPLSESVGNWMSMINSHGVEISITGGVEQMVRGPNSKSLFFFLFFVVFCYHLGFVL